MPSLAQTLRVVGDCYWYENYKNQQFRQASVIGGQQDDEVFLVPVVNGLHEFEQGRVTWVTSRSGCGLCFPWACLGWVSAAALAHSPFKPSWILLLLGLAHRFNTKTKTASLYLPLHGCRAMSRPIAYWQALSRWSSLRMIAITTADLSSRFSQVYRKSLINFGIHAESNYAWIDPFEQCPYR